MASATAYRVLIIYLFMIVGAAVITHGPQLSTGLISGNTTSIATAVAELMGVLGAATAISAFSGIFIGAFVVLGVFGVFQALFTSTANPIGSIMFSAAVGAPSGLSLMLVALGWLMTLGFDATFAWAVIAIFAG
jgi:hypothetical protein